MGYFGCVFRPRMCLAAAGLTPQKNKAKMDIAKPILIAGCIALTGCATTWYNPNFTSNTIHERQLVIDSAGCNRYALGASPMPPIRMYGSQPQNYTFSGTMSSYGSGGGGTSYFSGRATQRPAGSFSSGFAQGYAMGEAINAKKARDLAFKACMYQLGWTDSKPQGFMLNDGPQSQANGMPTGLKASALAPELIPDYQLGDNEEWQAEVSEFLTIFDQYSGEGPRYEALNKVVMRIAKQSDSPDEGQAILLAAHSEVATPSTNPKLGFPQQVYKDAVGGSSVDQFALSGMHLMGIGGARNPERAFYWCTKAAQAGDEDALAFLANFYAEGIHVKQDYRIAYRLLQAARLRGSDVVDSVLKHIEAKLTTAQAAEYRRIANF